jgi:hypothetical protein
VTYTVADHRAAALMESHALRGYARAGKPPPVAAPLRLDWNLTSDLKPGELLPDAGERNGKRAA